MNDGILGQAARRLDLGPVQIRAMVKFNAAGDTVNAASGAGPSAGFQYARSAIKAELNIARVIHNGTGDFTVQFAVDLPSEHFVMFGAAKAVTAGNGDLVNVHESDTGSAKEKRISVLRPSDAVEQNSTEVHLLFFA